MPTSSPLMDPYLAECVVKIAPRSVLDVGAGCGKSAGIIKKAAPGASITGLEVFKPYAVAYAAAWDKLYARTHLTDFDTFVRTHPDDRFDLIVFSDVLEHMRWADAISALYDACYHARHVIGIWPELRVQGESRGNAAEMHRSRLTNEDCDRFRVLDHVRKSDRGYVKHLVWWRGYLK